jgi:hypothetical protein
MGIPRTLRYGDKGYEISWWRDIVGMPAPFPEALTFDEALYDRTRAWQREEGLESDGVVGPLTWVAGLQLEVLRGIDVSVYQGDLVQAHWDAIRAAGVRFAYIRGAVGNDVTDAQLAANMERARRAGIRRTPYVFPYPLPKLDPRAQAEGLVARLGQHAFDVDLPIVFDLEWPPPAEVGKDGRVVDVWARWGCSPAQIRDWSLTCLGRGEELTGHRWMIYTYRYFWASIEGHLSHELMTRRLVLADYRYKGRVPSVVEAHGTRALENARTGVSWEPTIVQHDGDGGLVLPDGRDADFNVLLGGEALLEQLRFEAERRPEAPADVFTALPSLGDVLAGIAASRGQIRGALLEEGIDEYRRTRVDQAA